MIAASGSFAGEDNVAVLHAGALGDCVLAVHLISALKASWRANITLIARSPIAKWAAVCGLVDRALFLDDIGAHRWFRNDSPAVHDSVLRGFSQIVSFLDGPDEPISHRLREISETAVLAFDPKPKADLADVHIIQQWARQIEIQTGNKLIAAHPPQFPAETRAALRTALAERLAESRQKIIIVHPGSGGRAKCCPVDALEFLVRAFGQRGWRAVWMIGPDEVERDGTAFIQRLERTAPVLFEESVVAAADLAAGADAYIGNDAGMTHVAALAGVPTVALFGPTNPHIWRPLGRVHVVQFPHGDELRQWVGKINGCIEVGIEPHVSAVPSS